jgi:hypothetical protein
MNRKSQHGVALVITLILLSVITFLAVTFLVVTHGEREQTAAQSNQMDASLAAEAALDQAQATVVSSMMARNNGQDFGLLVSTNFINPNGFNPNDKSFPDPTNVNFNMDINGAPLSQPEMVENLLNSQIYPRPPVYVTTNKGFPPDFRYFLDLNRNGVYDTNGFGTNYGIVNGKVQFLQDANGYITNFFVGDPEWIGILDKPYLPHSSSNQYVARYAFFAIPIGNDLDLNYIHNDAKQLGVASQGNAPPTGYYRNQGVGSWEINLAAFLLNLNTNCWGNGGIYDGAGSLYFYDTNNLNASAGPAFQAAEDLLNYRYDNGSSASYLNLDPIFDPVRIAFSLYPYPYPANTPSAVNAFDYDMIDDYTHGPLWTTASSPTVDGDALFNMTTMPWPGANNPSHFFSTQDIFTPDANNPGDFSDDFLIPLQKASANVNSSYDRYTFYRLFQQAGFDSAPETSGKLNLNYVNVNGVSPTNFIPWGTNAVMFFTNAADVMLRSFAAQNPELFNDPKYHSTDFSVTNIEIYPTNYYTPAVNRLIQLAANIYDASTNRPFEPGGTNYFPSVFRPTFGVGVNSNVFINGYIEEGPLNVDVFNPIYALPDDLVTVSNTLIGGGLGTNMNIYGIPWVIGAKKSLPNFNGLAMSMVSQVTRRLVTAKASPYSVVPTPGWAINQNFQVGVSNVIDVSAWNSYINPYPRAVQIILQNDVRMALMASNAGSATVTPLWYSNWINGVTNVIPANTWPGIGNPQYTYPYSGSYWNWTSVTNTNAVMTPLVLVPDMCYRASPPGLTTTNNMVYSQVTSNVVHFLVTTTNRFRFIMRDLNPGPTVGRVIDFVTFNITNGTYDITADAKNTDQYNVWQDSPVPFWARSLPTGIQTQILVSQDSENPNGAWQNAQLPPASSESQSDGTKGFLNWLSFTNTGTPQATPFNPTAKLYRTNIWRINDPLVHYTLGDLGDPLVPAAAQSVSTLAGSAGADVVSNYLNTAAAGIGSANNRYAPWGHVYGGLAGKNYNLATTDPLVYSSDSWDFPTNRYPNIGWLGRVHRGTPWQTVYLKSLATDTNTWQTWAGDSRVWILTNGYISDAVLSNPTNDWHLLDLFTTAPNDNAARGRLSINQTNYAAWASVFSGVITLTNNSATGIQPVLIDQSGNDPNMQYLINAINGYRATNTAAGEFTNLGDILAVPQLTVASPFINTSLAPNDPQLSDEVYERLPQQVLGLLKVGQPRYVIFAYGQSLKPAPQSIMQNNSIQGSFGLCTNYQITGEVETRTVIRFDNPPVAGSSQVNQPHAVIESYNVVPPE